MDPLKEKKGQDSRLSIQNEDEKAHPMQLRSRPPTKIIFDDEKRIAAYLGLKLRVEHTHKGLLQLRAATNLRKTHNLPDMQAYAGMIQRRQR